MAGTYRLAAFTGMEAGNLTAFYAAVTNGVFDTIEANSTSPISLGYDLHAHVTDTTASSWGAGCYATIRIGNLGNWRQTTTDTFFKGAGTKWGFDISFRFKVVATFTGTNQVYIMNIHGASGIAQRCLAIICSGNSAGTIKLTFNTQAGNIDLCNITSGTVYDIRVKGIEEKDGKGHTTCWVLTKDTQTILGKVDASYNISSAPVTQPTQISFGAMPLVNHTLFLNNTQDYYFDDIVIRVGVTSDDTDSDNGSPLVYGASPNGTGTHNMWSTVGSSTHFHNVDDGPTVNYTDYNHTVAATGTTDIDSWAVGSYTGSGTVIAIASTVLHRQHTGGGVNDVFHRLGLWDGSAADYHGLAGAGTSTSTPESHIIETTQIGTTDLLTNTYANAIEVYVDKYDDLSGLNIKRVPWAGVEFLDDTGRTPFTDSLAQPVISSD